MDSEVLRLLDMPFLESVDGVDAGATRNLVQIWLSREGSPLAQLRSHPTLRDGITDDEASILAVLEIVNLRERSWLPEALFDPERTSTARRVISLPLAGETTLAVVSVVGGEAGSLNMLEGVVRAEEEFMGVPFPNSFAVFLIADASRRAGGAVFYSGAITVDPTFQALWGIVAHEVAHMYWTHGATRWITEGAAELMETISREALIGEVIGPYYASCSLAYNLGTLDRVAANLHQSNPETGSEIIYRSSCMYSLGLGLFLDLYLELGRDTFRPAFASLYTKLRDGEHDDRCTGLEQGVCYVQAAFVEDAPPEAEAIAEAIIDKWYHGSPP